MRRTKTNVSTWDDERYSCLFSELPSSFSDDWSAFCDFSSFLLLVSSFLPVVSLKRRRLVKGSCCMHITFLPLRLLRVGSSPQELKGRSIACKRLCVCLPMAESLGRRVPTEIAVRSICCENVTLQAGEKEPSP